MNVVDKALEVVKHTINDSIPLHYFEQNLDGDFWYEIINDAGYNTSLRQNVFVAQEHPILTTVINFVSQLFAQAEYWVEDSKGNKIENHWLTNLLSNPDYSLTGSDFSEAVSLAKYAYGTAVLEKVKDRMSSSEPTRLRLLDTTLIKFPDVTYTQSRKDDHSKTKITYDENGENRDINIGDLIFLRDIPISPSNYKNVANATGDKKVNLKYKFIGKSRIDGLRDTLLNTVVSLKAKKIILETNGKELISSAPGTGDNPLTTTEKDDVEKRLQNNYGLSNSRNRALVTKSQISWQSMHIALRDLGLDESVKTDGNIIYTAWNIPRDVISLDLKKASYQNQKESMVGYIQNDMFPQLKSQLESYNLAFKSYLRPGEVLKGSYDHLPIMQYVLMQRYEVKNKQADAFKKFVDGGMSPNDAAKQVDIDDETISYTTNTVNKNEK